MCITTFVFRTKLYRKNETSLNFDIRFEGFSNLKFHLDFKSEACKYLPEQATRLLPVKPENAKLLRLCPHVASVERSFRDAVAA